MTGAAEMFHRWSADDQTMAMVEGWLIARQHTEEED